MRQLKITKQHSDPTWETDKAQALLLLQSLAAAEPLGLPAEHEEHLLRFIVSVATQYRGLSAAWEELLRAGYAGAVGCVKRGREVDRWLAWWVRQGMLGAMQELPTFAQ